LTLLLRRVTGVLVLGALALAAAGCGGDDESGGSDTDLTNFAPEDAPIFVEGTIKPEGDLKDSIESILERFPDGDAVGDRLIDELNKSAEEDGSGVTYEDDVEPWLGQRAAFYASGFASGPSDEGFGGDSETEVSEGALLVETTDEDEAREKIREFAEEDGPLTEAEYNGVTYDTTTAEEPGDFDAIAVVDGVAIVATEQSLKDAIDANAGDNLSGQSEYASFREERGDDLALSAFADVGAILDAVPPSPGFSAQDREAFERAYGSLVEQPVMFGVTATSDQANIDFEGGSYPFNFSGASELLDAGFEDAWFAGAIPDIGKALGTSFDQFAAAGLPRGQLNQVNLMLQRQFGFTLDDIEGVGDLAVFAAGESIVDLQVGGLVEIPDAGTRDRLLAAMRTAIQRSAGAQVRPLQIEGADDGFSVQVPDLPVPINVAASGDRVAIGAGPATQALLSGEGGLTQSEAFQQAEEAVGGDKDISFFAQMEPIVDLVESTGQDDAEFQEVRPYLEAFDFFAGGVSSAGGDVISQRFVVRFSD
jgi:Protein of unknown function (DUF3352)